MFCDKSQYIFIIKYFILTTMQHISMLCIKESIMPHNLRHLIGRVFQDSDEAQMVKGKEERPRKGIPKTVFNKSG